MQRVDYEFEYFDVESPATDLLKVSLASGHGACIVGRPGVGKTHAVTAAVNGAIWSTVPTVSYAVPRVLADLARQAGGGPEIMGIYANDGCEAACNALDDAIGERVVVLDGVEYLWAFRRVDPFNDVDASALWTDEVESLRGWALRRVETTPTVLIGRWIPAPPHMLVVRHPDEWPVKLCRSAQGYVPWARVADHVDWNPGAMFLAAATLRLAGPDATRQWLDDTAKSEPRDRTEALGWRFRRAAPKELMRLLATLQAAGEVDRAVLERLATQDEELDFALDLARELRVLQEHAGVVRLMPYLEATGALPALHEAGADALASRVATTLLASVNDRSSLVPATALRVLDAHRLQLATGDLDAALTTARLHVGGLVAHARGLSLGAIEPADFDRARRAYRDIRSVLAPHPRYAGSRILSHVDHYHGYNGHRAHTLALGEVAEDYDSAISTWRENALWHARRIALAAESGDAAIALGFQRAAYGSVPDHERRDAYLRVRAAFWSSRAGADDVALQLLADYEPSPSLHVTDAVASQFLRRLHRRWARGVELARLSDGAGVEVVFHVPLRIRIEASEEDWSASTEHPFLRAKGAGPWLAVRQLATDLAAECLRLVQTPTGRLRPVDVARKGLYLAAVDLASSHIGLPFHTSRWLFGTISKGQFTPAHADLGPIPLAGDLSPTTDLGHFLARVPVDRTGHPSGPVDRLVEAGDGHGVRELLFALKRVAEEDDHAA